ncbi:hypothetical protein AB0M43_35865 [Longispora sp. NPDC051575]|uniref:hypothetical protein n=1 Tax=Longispora sp. NPDC051575 TaxID=3154943 RepID=UPI00343AA16A
MSRRIPSLLCTLALAVTAGLFTAGPAHAAPLDLTCAPPSSNVTSYNPPLTLSTTGTVQVDTTVAYGPCVSASHPAIVSGLRQTSFPVADGCNDLLGSGTITYTITWNTGQTSAITTNFTATVAGAAFVVVETGTITSGLFAGDTIVQNFTGPSTNITLCLLGLGTVPNIYAVGTVAIT